MAAAGWSREQTNMKIRSIGRISHFTCEIYFIFSVCLLTRLLSFAQLSKIAHQIRTQQYARASVQTTGCYWTKLLAKSFYSN